MHIAREFFNENKEYLKYGRTGITVKNRRTLRRSCLIYSLVLLLYTVHTLITHNSEILIKLYYTFDILHIILIITVFTLTRKKDIGFYKIQILCSVFEFLILSFFIIEAIYPFRDRYAIYIPIAILLVNLIFIHSVFYSVGLSIAYTGIFAILSAFNKTGLALQNDLLIAIATLLASVIGCIMIATLRQDEDRILRKYEFLSKYDMLTGLYNKSSILALCDKEIKKQSSTALFVMDIDNFKSINDNFGHYKGDEILHDISISLKKTFSEDMLIGRYGGDEFIIISKNPMSGETARHIALELQKSLSKIKFDMKIECCVGIYITKKGDTFDSAFMMADNAMYEAKRTQKNSVVIF